MGPKALDRNRTHMRIVHGVLLVLGLVGVVYAVITFPDAYFQTMFYYMQ